MSNPRPVSFGPGPLSRRHLLELLAAGGLITATGCVDTSGAGSNAGPTAKATAATFRFPDTGAKLPTGKVKLSWMDSGDVKAFFFKALAKAYHKKHPNITIDYNGSNWNNITQVLTTGLPNGSAPDVFQLPSQIPGNVAVANGWIGAFDDIVPNFAELKKAFPTGVFADGISDFNGKTYLMPMTSNNRIGNLLLSNRDLAKKSGVDLESKPISWDELRAVAKKITKDGAGSYYGLILGIAQPGGITGPASDMAQMSGLHNGIDAINWQTGEYNHTDPLAEEIIELFLAMRDDGSIHPDSVSLDAPGARGRMPQGQAGIMFQGPWNIPLWAQENPNFHLGLQLPAQKNPNDIWPLVHGPGGSNSWAYASKSKLGSVIGDIFAFWSTMAGQEAWATYDAAADPPDFVQALQHVKLGPLDAKAAKLGNEYTLIGPEPAVRNPDVQQVYLAQIPPNPIFSDRIVGLYTKQIKKPVAQVLKEAKDAAEKSLDDAIKKARKKGAKVSRDDFVFSDWDPRKPYTSIYKS